MLAKKNLFFSNLFSLNKKTNRLRRSNNNLKNSVHRVRGVLSIELFFRIFQVCWRNDVFRRNEQLFEGLEVSTEVETVVGSSGVVDVDLRFIHTNNRPTVEHRIAQWNPLCQRLCLCWYCRSHRRMWIICKLASLQHNADATATRRPRCRAGTWASPEYPATCPQTSQNCEYTQNNTNFLLFDTLFGKNKYDKRELRIRIFRNIINVYRSQRRLYGYNRYSPKSW